ncbi:MAG: hypothetical protein JSS56_04745 [Proteobacteria bacterium]|nr:hypothetical protein [Pseudomonadota bacterium]
MATKEIHARVSVAWWLRWYLCGVVLVAHTMGLHPDPDKVKRTAMRAIKITFE